MAKVLVVYHSGTGNTKAMVKAVAEGVIDTVLVMPKADYCAVAHSLDGVLHVLYREAW